MTEFKENSEETNLNEDYVQNSLNEEEVDKEVVKKDVIPHFFPTYRIKRKLYPIPMGESSISSNLLCTAISESGIYKNIYG